MSIEFKQGNVVRLKNGIGPKMVVENNPSEKSGVKCVWYDDHRREYQEKNFVPEILMIAQ